MSRGYKDLQAKLDELAEIPGHGFTLTPAQVESIFADMLEMEAAIKGRKPLGTLGQVMGRLPDVPSNVVLTLDLATANVLVVSLPKGSTVYTINKQSEAA